MINIVIDYCYRLSVVIAYSSTIENVQLIDMPIHAFLHVSVDRNACIS